jgi:hypothetical protein
VSQSPIRDGLTSRASETHRIPANVFNSISIVALLALVGLVLFRLGAFNLTETVASGDGRMVDVVNTFASVDHPFHATRAATLLDSLWEARIPRWIRHHQGGYPAEFYPLGGAWIEALIWALMLGMVPILAVHKLAVIAVFLLPVLGFVMLSRHDRLPLVVAVTAAAMHVSLPGGTFEGGAYSGGYRELVSWGLFTNVSASVVVFLIIGFLLRYVERGRRWAGAIAASGAAFAIATNPRSGIGLVAIGLAVVIVLGIGRRETGIIRVAIRLGIVAGISALMSAPVLVSLIQYNDLYHFVRYSGYEAIGDYLFASISAVTLPVLALAIVGAGWAFAAPGRKVTQTTALAGLMYAAMTVGMSTGIASEGPFDQLEPTRLMPLQRLIVLYLAAVGVHATVGWAMPAGKEGRLQSAVQLSAAAAVVLAFVIAPFGTVAREDRGMFPVPTTATASMTSLRRAVMMADRVAPPGSALYVVGSALSWHQQLWSPLWTERPLRYNDWLWSWEETHVAPGYVEADGNAFSSTTVSRTFNADFLQQEGLGAVIVTGERETAIANDSAALRRVLSGTYSVYEVVEPSAIVTFDSGQITEIEVEPERVEAVGASEGGLARIRINWFPRWQATVNGDTVPVQRTADGYMAVEIPSGTVSVKLTYAVTPVDLAARIAGLVGIVSLLALATRLVPRVTSMARWEHR